MDKARALVDRVADAVAAGDDVRAAEVFSESAQVVVRDREHDRLTMPARIALAATMAAFTDLSYSSVSHAVGEEGGDDGVLSGVHRATFLGCPATGRRVYLNVHLSGHEDGGALTGLVVTTNVAALMHQLQGGGDATAVADALQAQVRHRMWAGPPAELELAAGTPAPADDLPPRRTRRGRIAMWASVALAVLLLAGAAVVLLPRFSGGGQTAAPAPASLAVVGLPSGPPTPTLTVGKPSTAPSPTSSASAAPAPPAIVTATGAPQVQAGRQVVLPSDVLFAQDSAELSPQTQSALSGLAQQILAARVTGQIQVNGYTDNLGSAQHGLELSRQRALAVAQALQAALGTAPVTLLPQGFGDADPIADNGTEQGRARNRRVTIVLPASSP